MMRQLRQLGAWESVRRMLMMGLLAAVLVAGCGYQSSAEASPILINPADGDRGIDAFIDGNFMCCQMDDGLAMVTLNSSFEERVGIEFALAELPSHAAITAATLKSFRSAAAAFMSRSVTEPSGVFTIWTASSGFERIYPTLAIEYEHELVPEPGSLLLLGTGLVLVARRLRHIAPRR